MKQVFSYLTCYYPVCWSFKQHRLITQRYNPMKSGYGQIFMTGTLGELLSMQARFCGR